MGHPLCALLVWSALTSHKQHVASIVETNRVLAHEGRT